MDEDKEMKRLYNKLVNFKESPLYEYRVQNDYFPVMGGGSHEANCMFIGEAPGKKEAETGKPFCGRSGVVLDALLKSVKLSRDEIYITSIVKDRPPKNRDPHPLEIELYGPYLDKQIEIIKPKLIATLGRFSMEYIFRKFGLGDDLRPIGKLHGKIFTAKTSYGKVIILPLYHPAVAVYNSNKFPELQKDFKLIKKSI